MPLLDRDGTLIHYEIHGVETGRLPLLLTHGVLCSARMWEPNLPALSAERRVLVWDQRGHARSDAPDDPRAYSPDLSVGDMAALLDVLGAERAVIGGMSLGGYLSLAFNMRHPDRVGALVLVDTGPGFRRDEPRAEWNAGTVRTAERLERDGFAALPDGPEVTGARHPSMNGLVHTARRVLPQRDGAMIESLGSIAVPTLIVVGSEDAPFLAPAEYMAKRIAGARKVVLEGAGHAANLDRPREFGAAVGDFLAGVDATERPPR